MQINTIYHWIPLCNVTVRPLIAELPSQLVDRCCVQLLTSSSVLNPVKEPSHTFSVPIPYEMAPNIVLFTRICLQISSFLSNRSLHTLQDFLHKPISTSCSPLKFLWCISQVSEPLHRWLCFLRSLVTFPFQRTEIIMLLMDFIRLIKTNQLHYLPFLIPSSSLPSFVHTTPRYFKKPLLLYTVLP